MSRWIDLDHSKAVLAAADAWRSRCFQQDGSLFSDEEIWTLGNVQELKRRLTEDPIEGTEENFIEKLKIQLEGAAAGTVRLAAEVVWFLLLYPISSVVRPETKRKQIREIWSWSGPEIPDSPHLGDESLLGVGNPGIFYRIKRYRQVTFFLEVIERWKALTEAERNDLLLNDVPWQFMEWLDRFEDSDRLPMRNIALFFLFPDELERIVSNEQRRQIVKALKHRLPRDLQPSSSEPSLIDLDRAMSALRKGFEEEFDTHEIDFYRPPVYGQWFTGIRENARKQVGADLKKILDEYNLELRQCGSKKKSLATCKPVDVSTGFWENPPDATNKPLRWLVHLEVEDGKVVARVPELHGSRRIAFANTAQGTSGAVTTRIVPVIKVGDEEFVFHETWEWLLLHCFLPALAIGSSGQLFDRFDETTGRLDYMGREQPYIAAALIALNEEDDLFQSSELSGPITYREATEAIADLINVSPMAMPSSDTATIQ